MLRRTFAVASLVLMCTVSAALAQPGGGPGGRGGPGGFFGRGFNPMAIPGAEVYLLASPDVQKEIAVTDDQKTKVTELAQKTQEDMRSEMRSTFQNMGNLRDMSD